MGGCSTKVTPAATHKAGTPLYGEQPAHWSEVATKEYQSNGFRAVKLARDDGVWQQLERFLELDDPQNLGRGRDMQQKAKQKYDQLRLLAAWRVQNPALWSRYTAGKAKIRRDVHNLQKLGKGLPKRGGPGLPLRLHDRAKALPGERLDDEIRETMLMHGTKPQFLLDILSNGPNERYSGASESAEANSGPLHVTMSMSTSCLRSLVCATFAQRARSLHATMSMSTSCLRSLVCSRSGHALRQRHVL